MVLLVVVVWVWANVEATAKPKMMIMAPSENNVFISDRDPGSMRANKENRYAYLTWM